MVFLTTLSVYLGLVLVGGATSPVLAQTTQEKGKLQVFVGQSLYGNAIDELVKEIEKFRKAGKIKANEKFALDYDFGFFKLDSSPQFLSSGSRSNEDVAEILDQTAEKISRDLSKLENIFFKSDDRLGSFDISFAIEQKDLNLKVKTSYPWNKDAQSIGRIFSKYFEQESIVRKNEPVGIVYDNTKIVTENNQILIVTHLPRASIDALLAEKNAK